MFDLPISETILFISVVLIYLAAAVVGVFQFTASGKKHGVLLRILICLGVFLSVMMLILRGIEIKAVPLTGLFDSMIVLNVVFGLTYLLLSIVIRQMLFGTVMSWVILILILMAGTVAKPATQPQALAATPWAMAHGIAMILGASATLFAAATAFLYLLGKRRLKQKKISQVIGKVPNIEKLEKMNMRSLEFCFLFLTVGLVSGFGMAMINKTVLEMSLVKWLIDPKIILVDVIWLMLCVLFMLKQFMVIKGKITAYITMAAFVLFLYAIVGTTIICCSKHDFGTEDANAVEVKKITE